MKWRGDEVYVTAVCHTTQYSARCFSDKDRLILAYISKVLGIHSISAVLDC